MSDVPEEHLLCFKFPRLRPTGIMIRVRSIGAKLVIRGNRKNGEKTATHYPPLIVQETGLRSKPFLRGDRPATNRLRQGTALKYRVIRNDCRGFNNLVLQMKPHVISFYGLRQ